LQFSVGMRALLFVLVGSAACETSEVEQQADAAEAALLGPRVSLAPTSELDVDDLRTRLAKLEVALAELETLPDPDATEEVAAMQLRRLELVAALGGIEREDRDATARLERAVEQLEQDVRDTKRAATWTGDPDEELLMRNDHSANNLEHSVSYEILVENACWIGAE
jgi:hypothetical protein